jgi:carboxypeptidase D
MYQTLISSRQNPWTWVNLTNVIWVDQPVGTGFSTGNASAVSEEDVAQQFLGFWKNFVDTFELQQRKVYLTGESYAGMFIPYIADAMFTRNDTAYFNVEATLMFDPLINSNAVMRQIPAFAFAKEWKDLIGLNTTFMKDIEKRAADCGYTDFLGEYLEFPPKQRLPSPPVGQMNDEGDTVGYCDIWGSIVDASLLVNPVSCSIVRS